MPYYTIRGGSYTEWVENDNILVNQWHKVLGRLHEHPKDKYGHMPRIEVGKNRGKLHEDGTGRIVSPKFVEYLYSKGFKYSEQERWFEREWSCWTPERSEIVIESYKYDIDDKIWTYRILDKRLMPPPPRGIDQELGSQNPYLIWVDKVGSKE